MPSIVNFHFVGYWIFLFVYKHCWTLFWGTSKLFENCLTFSFWGLHSGYVRLDQNSFYSGTNFVLNAFLNTLHSAPWFMRSFSHSVWWDTSYLWPYMKLFLSSFGVVLLPTMGSFLIHICWLIVNWGGPLLISRYLLWNSFLSDNDSWEL